MHALSPEPLCLTRFTRRVQRVHRVPPYGADPLRWLDAALATYQSAGMDVLLPTQEQVAVLSAAAGRVRAAGVRTAVPPFTALARVQDKISAFATLTAAGLPQPPGTVLGNGRPGRRVGRFPVFLKLPIGTATTGVSLVTGPAGRDRFVAAAGAAGAFTMGGLLAQRPVDGPLVMTQSVFDRGELVAWHACLRVREGTSGGASHKRSASLPAIREHLTVLGRQLGWHGALSADAILSEAGPCYIDINPRLVEPGNAWRAGVDLVAPLLDLARGTAPPPQPGGRPEVRTHQLLIALLGAAQRTGRRRDVAAELLAAARRAGDYAGSAEELTPVRRDPRAAVPVALAAAATVIGPAAWRWFAAGSVRSYALSPEGWRTLLDLQPPAEQDVTRCVPLSGRPRWPLLSGTSMP